MTAKKLLFFNARAVLFNIVIVSALLAGNLAFPTSASAMGLAIEVNTTADNTTKDGLCSLREAITNANKNWQYYSDCTTGFSDDGIVFSTSLGTATIPLSSDLPSVTDLAGLNINGGGDITIDGQYFRIFYVEKNVSLTLDSLILYRGGDFFTTNHRSGGCLYNNDGHVTITNSTVSSCLVKEFGGGIYTYRGSLTITKSTFQGNFAGQVPGNNDGGGIFSNGSLLTITDSTFSGNNAYSEGGGIYIGAGTTTITNSTFSGNGDRFIFGGAIYAETGTLNIMKSTFIGNNANLGGGIFIRSTITNIANSTFSGNSNSAVKNLGTSTTILNSTFSGNSDARLAGGAIANDGKLDLFNTILANTTSGPDCFNNPGGSISGNNNLIETDSLSPGECGTAALTGDPILGALSSSPSYFPLNSGSPAINAGDDAICAASPVDGTSQNGVPRYQGHGAPCDIGSFEVQSWWIPVPEEPIGVLNKAVHDLMETGALSADNGKKLLSMLEVSLQAFVQNDVDAGIKALGGFIDQLNMLIHSGEVGSSDGQALIDVAQTIIDDIYKDGFNQK